MKCLHLTLMVLLFHSQEAFTSTHITVFFPYSGFSIGLAGSAGERLDGDYQAELAAAEAGAQQAKKYWKAKQLPYIQKMMDHFKNKNHPYQKSIQWIDFNPASSNHVGEFHFPDTKERVAIALNLKTKLPPSALDSIYQFQIAQFLDNGPGTEIFKKWGNGEDYYIDEPIHIANFVITHKAEVEKEKYPQNSNLWDSIRFFRRQLILQALNKKAASDSLIHDLLKRSLNSGTDWSNWRDTLFLAVALAPDQTSTKDSWIKIGKEIILKTPKSDDTEIDNDARMRINLQDFVLKIYEDSFQNEIEKNLLEKKYKHMEGEPPSASGLFMAEARYRAALQEIGKKNIKLAVYILRDLIDFIPHYKDSDQLLSKLKK